MAKLRKEFKKQIKEEGKNKKKSNPSKAQKLRNARIHYICDLLRKEKMTEEEIHEKANSGRFKDLNPVRLFRVSEIRLSLNKGDIKGEEAPKTPIEKFTERDKEYKKTGRSKAGHTVEKKQKDKKQKPNEKVTEKESPKPKKKKCPHCTRMISTNALAWASHAKTHKPEKPKSKTNKTKKKN